MLGEVPYDPQASYAIRIASRYRRREYELVPIPRFQPASDLDRYDSIDYFDP